MKLNEVVKEKIREYMMERFYIEGEKEDFYFGKSILNDGLTVFYNLSDNELKNGNLRSTISGALINSLYYKNFSKYNLTNEVKSKLDLSKSAFAIPVFSEYYEFFDKDDDDGDRIPYTINYMPTGVLEQAAKENPKRWKMYLKFKDNQ